MLHIVQHPKSKKYELVAVAKNGDYLVGSNQGYEKKAGVYKCLRSLMRMMQAAQVLVQDDTTTESSMWTFSQTERNFMEGMETSKKYNFKKEVKIKVLAINQWPKK